MDMDKVPSLVIEEICSFLSFEDVQSLMKTNRNNYCAIKSHKLDKIRLKSLRVDTRNLNIPGFSTQHAIGVDLSGRNYKFANFTVTDGEEDTQIKQVLDQVCSVDELDVYRNVFSMELFDYLMASTIKIKVVSIHKDGINISANDLVKFCRKYPIVKFNTSCQTFTDAAIWSDEVLTSVLPSTICKRQSIAIIGGPDLPMPITDRTLDALTKWMPNYFSLERIHMCITIEGILKAIETLLDKKKTDVHWQLGCLNRNQKTLADRYRQKEAGRGFYFIRHSESYCCEYQYEVIDSANGCCFMLFHTNR